MLHKLERKEGSSSDDSSALLSPRTQSAESSLSPDDANPPFWAPGDRPGQKGLLDRRRRKSRLIRSICLDAKQLRDVLRFILHNDSPDGIKWTPDILFAYVPRTFEDATTTETIAAQALFHVIAPSLAAIFKTTHSSVLSLNKYPQYVVFEFFWHGSPPVVPLELRDLPNIKLTREEPEMIYPDTIKSGSKIIVPDQLSLNLNSTFSFGTVGYVAVIEELGERRLVLVTAGHVVDGAHSIQVVPGVPLFRRGEPVNAPPASLNETCLLKTYQYLVLLYDGWVSMLGNMVALRRLVNEGNGIPVYKCGASTSYTAGILGGDSGSLVFAKDSSYIILEYFHFSYD
ncbi:hypothetical protein MGYG_09211 [Nannizzia gypsea CBS 118893]|uniref:Uncharacterized protein n=1 Tax=Arthroderma gypseum (strain ATCC MYA-4604 / CBS 118893) TaxID=535722 RepID=E4V738_ARTGP|nr:hypothetical protein MGYG_09211 [Nannizzia gypsea CBS 118893]EFQ96904.1 hypothetical protein MGYG_09211 [Nannizzia gypsea CBS 118893]